MSGYRLTKAAADDVVEIYQNGFELFGMAQADAYQAGLQAAFAFLADTPLAARLRREAEPPARAWRYKAHLIVYIVDSDGILVVRVRHGREDWASGDA